MRRSLALFAALFLVLPSSAATHRTGNFEVEAETAEIANRFAKAAEEQRRQVALRWLGKELPPWSEPCVIVVKITWERPSGATTITFDPARRGIVGQKMSLAGPLDKLLTGPLPHEMAHVVFANFLGRPVPRWADEGGAVLSEGAREREAHTRHMDKIRKEGGTLPLRRLLELRDYLRDDLSLFYGQSFSVTDFLVARGGARKFLNFVEQGLSAGWDKAGEDQYGFANVERLEEAWRTWQGESASRTDRPPVVREKAEPLGLPRPALSR